MEPTGHCACLSAGRKGYAAVDRTTASSKASVARALMATGKAIDVEDQDACCASFACAARPPTEAASKLLTQPRGEVVTVAFRDRSPAPRRGGIMTTAATAVTQREPELLGQTVVVIGGSSGIGLETARRARAEGASVILAGRNPERLKQAALELGAQRTAAFDANDPSSLRSFFHDLPTPIDHVMVTAGAPRYGPPLEMPPEEARRGLTERLLLALEVARGAADKVRPPGSL